MSHMLYFVHCAKAQLERVASIHPPSEGTSIRGNRALGTEYPCKSRELEGKREPPACLPRAPKSIRLFPPHLAPLITSKTSSLGGSSFSLEIA